MHMACLHTRLHISSSSGCVIIGIEQKITRVAYFNGSNIVLTSEVRITAILLLSKLLSGTDIRNFYNRKRI
jgi:hypothetical protein